MVLILTGLMDPNLPSLFGKMMSQPSWVTVFLLTPMGAGVAQPVSHFFKEQFVMYLLVGSILFNSTKDILGTYCVQGTVLSRSYE